MLKIAYVVFGILGFFLWPGIIVRMLARTVGIMAAVRRLPPSFLDTIEPSVKMWSGGLILLVLCLWTSWIVFIVFEIALFMWISRIFSVLLIVTLVTSFIAIRRKM